MNFPTAVALALVSLAALSPFVRRSTAQTTEAQRSGDRQDWKELSNGVLRDGIGGLQWTHADNGQDIDWKAALAFCAAKGAGWRLPSAEELEALFARAKLIGDSAKCGKSTCRAPALFRLTGAWFWSSSRAGYEQDDGRADVWGVVLVNGARTSALADIGYGSRALCVRSGR